jgi:hypothetical protein
VFLFFLGSLRCEDKFCLESSGPEILYFSRLAASIFFRVVYYNLLLFDALCFLIYSWAYLLY